MKSKPTYPELLKAFKFSTKPRPTEDEEQYIVETIDRLCASEDWDEEKDPFLV